jgi:carboxylate-amine ligase
MTKISFAGNRRHTVGVELELALVDDTSMALASAIQPLLAEVPSAGDIQRIKAELMQCCVEIITDVCETIDDAQRDLSEKITQVETICDRMGLRLFWGATHPFSRWHDQEVTVDDRYAQLVNLLQEMARRLVTFGLHVHVGVDSGDKAVMICDRIMQHLPTVLALSCSSPFWENRDTGLQSHRSKIMEGLPTAGLPTLMRNWSEYVWLVNHMVDTGFINTIREIWWDVRPHHNFGTVEVRVCDMPGNLRDTMGITALIQCLVKALSDDIDQGAYQHDCHPMMVRQNKWRACRFGVKAELVDSYTYAVRPIPMIIERLVKRLRPAAEELGCVSHLEHCQHIVESPSWADRQKTILESSGDPAEVVRQLTDQTRLSPKPTPVLYRGLV